MNIAYMSFKSGATMRISELIKVNEIESSAMEMDMRPKQDWIQSHKHTIFVWRMAPKPS